MCNRTYFVNIESCFLNHEAFLFDILLTLHELVIDNFVIRLFPHFTTRISIHLAKRTLKIINEQNFFEYMSIISHLRSLKATNLAKETCRKQLTFPSNLRKIWTTYKISSWTSIIRTDSQLCWHRIFRPSKVEQNWKLCFRNADSIGIWKSSMEF